MPSQLSCLGSSVGRPICLEHRVLWVSIPPEAQLNFSRMNVYQGHKEMLLDGGADPQPTCSPRTLLLVVCSEINSGALRDHLNEPILK